MKIGIAGGLGFEKEIIAALQGHQIMMIGSSYDCGSEKFIHPAGVEFIGEYVTHNYASILSECDLLIDFSENLKSKYLLNEISHKYKKPFITLFYRQEWSLFYYDGENESACLCCLSPYEKPAAPFSVPEPNIKITVQKITEIISNLPKGTVFLNLNQPDMFPIPVKLSDSCKTHQGNHIFLNGQMADVSSVSCSDNSVSISPMNEFTIDLKSCREDLSNSVKIIKETPFFIEFKTCHLSFLLFRQGRLVVKGSKEKNTAYYLYRYFVGS